METQAYDAIIVGGGIAGLQASIQLGRYMHKVLVIDKGTGRSTLCRSYHNVLGYPDGVAGEELRAVGRRQAESYGVAFREEEAVKAQKLEDERFRVGGSSGADYEADVLLIATGVTDRLPDVPGLKPCLGRTVYICPDCDGYEVRGKMTVVLGSGAAGAGLALALRYFTDRLTLVNHAFEGEPARAIPDKLEKRLQEEGIGVVTGTVEAVLTHGDGMFAGVRLTDGRDIAGERAFTGFGGNEINTELFKQLGAERMESKHVIADPRTK